MVKFLAKLKNCWIGTKIGMVVVMTVMTVMMVTKIQKKDKMSHLILEQGGQQPPQF